MRIKRFINEKKEQFNKALNKGAFHIFIGSFITKFVAFFGSIFIVRVLSKQDYGILGYVENMFNYAYVLTGMGLVNALLRYVILEKAKEKKHSYYKYVIKASTLFNVFLVGAACAFAIFYPHPDQFASARWLLPILLLSLPFRSLCDSNNSMLRAMFDNKRYAFFTCLLSVMVIGSKYISALLFGLNGAIVSPVIIYSVFAIILGIIIKRTYFSEKDLVPKLESKEKKAVNKYSIQYMITNSIWTLFMLNDVLLLGQLTGNSVMVAEYKVAYVLPANLSLISASIGIFVAPYFVRHEKDHGWIRRQYKKVFNINIVMIGLVAAVLFIFAEPIITLLYGASYATVVPIMRVLIIAAFVNTGLRYTNANLLAAMGHIKHNLLISFIGVILQLGINVFVIPRFGAMGVAYTSVFVYFCMAVALMIVFWSKFLRKKSIEI